LATLLLSLQGRNGLSELLNFPFIDQLDGSENAQFNCVPASICAGIKYLTGKVFSPDQLKDAAYGPNWSNNGTAASAYVPFCAKQGVKLSSQTYASPQEAVRQAHALLARGIPVLFTQQDDYAPAPYRDMWTHVCIWYKDAPGSLTAMDPFGGQAITYTDSVWSARLRSNELWLLEKEATVTIPKGWKDDGKVLTAPNGVQVRTGFRDYILAHEWDPDNTPEQAEQGLASLEISNPGLGGGTWQPFKKSVLEWTATGGVFPMYAGRELLATRKMLYSVATQLNTALAQAKTLQAQLAEASANADPTLKDYQNRLDQIHTLSDRTGDFLTK
jgi:hypothetical protein